MGDRNEEINYLIERLKRAWLATAEKSFSDFIRLLMLYESSSTTDRQMLKLTMGYETKWTSPKMCAHCKSGVTASNPQENVFKITCNNCPATMIADEYLDLLYAWNRRD